MTESWRIAMVGFGPDDRGALQRMLLRDPDRRYTILPTDSGAAGIAAGAGPRCLLLDIDLPDSDAPQLLAPLGDADGAPACPVVALTRGGAAAGRAALRAGAHEYIGWSWLTAQGLHRAIESAAERWRAARESRRHGRDLQTFADNSPDILTRFDRELRHVFVNAAVEAASGRPRSDFLGRTNRELGMPAPLCAQWETSLEQVFATGQPRSLEFAFDAQGTTRHYAARLVPEFDAHGVVGSVLGVTHDVTDRRAAELSARQSAEWLQMALSAAHAGAWTWDIGTGSITWSPENFALYGLDPAGGQPRYEDWGGQIHPDDRALAETAVREALEGRAPEFGCEFRVAHRAGAERWLLGLGKVEVDAAGRPTRMGGINLDITDRKRMERALRDQDERKNDFLATLAHELRNPLAPIRSGLEVLKRAAADGPQAGLARDMIERQLGHLVRLVDDLLDVSRINSGRIALKRMPVTIQSVAQQAVEASRPLLDAAHHRLTVRVPDEPLWIDGDLVRLCQVVSNLLNNAAKYTPPGGHVELGVVRQGDTVELRVTDDGLGISAEMLPLVFGMFVQIEQTVGSAQGGLGIGLSLVRKLLELHGGSISAHSAGLGRGSTFTLRLPLTSPPAAVAGQDAKDAATPREPAPAAAHAPPCSILVVDDNADAAGAFALLLRFAGHETRIAGDGAQALAAVQAFEPDVVFLDIGLPDISGYEVARRLRTDPRSGAMLLVALTGWGSVEDQQRAAEAGFDHHLTKPVELETVEALLAAHAQQRRRGSPDRAQPCAAP